MSRSTYFKKCSICHNDKFIFLITKNKEFICRQCHNDTKKEKCCKCNKYKFLTNNICNSCYNSTYKEKCIICKKLKFIYKKNENGDSICKKCGREKQICFICKNLKTVSIRDKNKNAICEECRNKNKIEKCIICNKMKSIHIRTKNNEPICKRCGEKKEKCIFCKKLKSVNQRDKNRNAICCKCGTKKEICCICKKLKKICTRDKNKNAICDICQEKIRLKNDKNFLVTKRLRYYVRIAFNRYSKTGKIRKSKLYGISYEKIIEHLKPFPENIKEYHIDHIIPLSAFDLNNPVHILAAFSPENHQWLKAKDNISKNAKYNIEDFETLIKKIKNAQMPKL